jgi:ADP-heptose:LPS heptosyltransferase
MKSRAKHAVAIGVDAVLSLIAPILVRRASAPVLPPNPRVLLIRCDHLGDAAMATAVIGPIRRALRASRLDMLVAPWAAPLFEHHPAVDGVITVATPWWLAARGAPRSRRLQAWGLLPKVIRYIRAGRYDVGIDLRGDLRQILLFLVLGRCSERVSSDRTGGTRLLTRSARYHDAQHEVEKNVAVARLLGVDGDVELEPPSLPELPRMAEESLRSVAGPRGYITLSVRGTKRNRTWPARHGAMLAEHAAAKLGVGTVYVGGEEDREIAEEIAAASPVPIAVLAGRLSLLQSLAVIIGARAAVAVDSGPMHLAALVGTPVVALFGPADPLKYRPWTSRSEIVTVRAPCGCVDPDCVFTATGPGVCMIELTPRAVFEALERLIAASEPPRLPAP